MTKRDWGVEFVLPEGATEADYRFLDENSHEGMKVLWRLMVNGGLSTEEANSTLIVLHAAGFRIVAAQDDDEEDETVEPLPSPVGVSA